MSARMDKKSDDGPPEESPVDSPSHTSVGRQSVERAEEAAETHSGGGWWGSWISAAKDKSVEVLGMVKKDLDELSTAVKSEASHVINTTSSAIGKTLRLDEPESTANTMKKSFSTFIDQVSEVLNPSPDDDDTEVYIITDGEPVPLTSLQKEVLALQRLDATYLVAPEGEALERLKAWRSVHAAPSQAAVERMLKASPLLREKMERLVPAALDLHHFWERYLFRKALLEDRLCNLNNPMSYQPSDAVVSSLLEAAAPDSPSPSDSVRSNCGSSPVMTDDRDQNVQWDNEDFAMDVELSEEQQIKLLEEYEEEIRSAKQSATLPSIKQPSVTPSPTKSVSSPQLSGQNKGGDKSPKKQIKIAPLKRASDAKSKSSETVSNVQKAISKKLTQNQKEQAKKLPKQTKSDLQSKLVEDHFVDDTVKSKKDAKSLSEELADNKTVVVDNASSNSDESWEKEFEL